MKSLCVLSLITVLSLSGVAQQANQVIPPASPQAAVPRLIRFAGQAKDATGKPVVGTVGITFTLHKSQTDSTALWIETQNVQADASGKYTALLGATKPNGIPTDLFISGEAQWLGVQVQGQEEQPRVLLVSVPYALKAGEAETLAGHSASDFVTSDKVTTLVKEQLQNNATTGSGSTITKQTSPTSQGQTSFAASTSNYVVAVTQSSTGTGVTAIAPGTAVYGTSTNTSGNAYGVKGQSASSSGFGVYGLNTATNGSAVGIYGQSSSNAGVALTGNETSTSGTTKGIVATVNSPSGIGMVVQNTNANGKLFSGQAGPSHTEVFSLDGAGNVVGNSFTGSGSGLTGVAQLGGPYAIFSGYVEGHIAAGAGNAALLGWGSSGSIGTFGDSDSGWGVEGESGTGFGVYARVTNPHPSAAGVLGFTGSGFSGSYSTEAALANAGVWADNSSSGTGVPVALFATTDNGYGAAVFTNTSNYPAVFVHNGTGSGIQSEATTGNGVVGTTTGGGSGVAGTATGLAQQEAGVQGTGNSSSTVGADYDIFSGVWGDIGTSAATASPAWPVGILGTADDAFAGVFLNNSTGSTTLYVHNYGTGGTGLVAPTTGSAAPGLFATLSASTRTGTCGIGGNGDLTCTGQVKTLATTSGARTVETYAMHSPENWMEDFGSASLHNGVAVVNIDSTFAETISTTADYHIFITPKGDSKGLYIASESATSFEVRESGGGTSSLAFDYRIVAKRRGYEAQRLTDVTERFQAEQKGLERHVGVPARSAVSPSPLLANANTKPVKRTVGPSPRPHAAAKTPAVAPSTSRP